MGRKCVPIYNTAVVSVNAAAVRNVYADRTVINNTTVVNRASFNGAGGIAARPSFQEQMAAREQHFQPTANQMSHEQTAARDRSQLASVNNGRPGNAAMDSVNGRRFNQQGRIANGIGSGRVNAREARNDRQDNGGKLTPQEHRQVNRQQNNLSRSIYDDKHNAQANKRAGQHKNAPAEKHEARRE